MLIALCITACLAPPQKALAAVDVCFVSVNDRLLDLGSRAENIGGGWYVPCTAFADFGINYSYFANSSTAMLFTAKQQFFFDFTNSTTYDIGGNYYGAYGVLSNGVSYVPVSFVCAQFGLTYTFISGNGYGNICRIKDGSAVLSDAQFLSAASSQMAEKYNSYINVVSPTVTATVTPPKQQAAGTETVHLSFQGLPSDVVLEALKSGKIISTFFLAPDDIKKSPDTVRHIVGDGHYVGILCATYDAFEKGAAQLYEAAHIATVLAAAPEGSEKLCQAMAKENGIIYCGYTVDAVRDGEGLASASYITSRLGNGANYSRILCGDAATRNIRSLVNYFLKNNCRVLPTNEIDHG